MSAQIVVATPDAPLANAAWTLVNPAAPQRVPGAGASSPLRQTGAPQPVVDPLALGEEGRFAGGQLAVAGERVAGPEREEPGEGGPGLRVPAEPGEGAGER